MGLGQGWGFGRSVEGRRRAEGVKGDVGEGLQSGSY